MASLRSLAWAALDPLSPDSCAVCALPGVSVCTGCRERLTVIGPPLCERCGHPWLNPVPRCRACLPGLPRSRAALAYDAGARRALSALKDRGRRRVAEALADVIAERIAPPPADVIVPVPIGRSRRAERGFNQCELIGRELAATWEIPSAGLLRRVREGPPQRGRPRPERRRAQRGAFEVVRAAPRSVCLVDDVHTTGATLAASAAALRAAGVERIAAVTVARVPLGEAAATV